MRIRPSITLAAAAALSAAALAVPALAATGTASHTLRFTAVAVSRHSFGGNALVEIDKDVHAGKTVAYDELDITANTATVALGLKHGFLYGKFTINEKTGTLAGKVTGGTGAYKGASGTITGTIAMNGNASVKVVYK